MTHPIRAAKGKATVLFGNRQFARLSAGFLAVVLTAGVQLVFGSAAGLVAALVLLAAFLFADIVSPFPSTLAVTDDGLSATDMLAHPDGEEGAWLLPWECVDEIRPAHLGELRVFQVVGHLHDEVPRPLVTLGRQTPTDARSPYDVLEPAASFELLRAHAPDAVPFGEAPEAPEEEARAEDGPKRRPSRARRLAWTVGLAALALLSFSIGSSWTFAFAIVAVLFVHEGGHALAVLVRGLPLKSLVFVPFLGAAVVYGGLDKASRGSGTRVFIALAGPLIGGLVALAVWYQAPAPTSFAWWFAHIGVVVNLFNLLPVLPLDGGQILRGLVESRTAPRRSVWLSLLLPSLMFLIAAGAVVVFDGLLVRLLFLAFGIGASAALFDDPARVVTERWLRQSDVPPARLRAARAWFAGGMWTESGAEEQPMKTLAAGAYAVATLGLAAALGWALLGGEPPIREAAPVAARPPHPLPAWPDPSEAQIGEAARLGLPVRFENEIGMRFVLVPAGTFHMGSPEDEKGRQEDELLHEVEVERAFYLQLAEVTNWQYRRFRPHHWVYGGRRQDGRDSVDVDRHPVGLVGYDDAEAFAAWASRLPEGRTYRLPTEAEWEYACRAGTTTRFFWGDSEADAHRYANARDASLEAAYGRPASERSGFPADDGHPSSAPVGSYLPNAWGLYDMLGNAEEWCLGRYVPYPGASASAPARSRPATDRVVRGGTFVYGPELVRSAYRGRVFAGYVGSSGLRLVSPAVTGSGAGATRNPPARDPP